MYLTISFSVLPKEFAHKPLLEEYFGNPKVALSKHLDYINKKLVLLLGYLHKVKVDRRCIGHGCLYLHKDIFLVEILYSRKDYFVNSLCDVGVYGTPEKKSYIL